MSLTSNDVPADGFSREVMAAYENWSYSSLPPSVVKRIKLFVLDTLGVIGAAADAPGIPEVNSLLLGWEGAGPSTILIGKGRVAPPTAALANGAAAHALDFDDNHDPGRVHSYAVILPAALAAAEARGGVSGRELIAALATGVELQARLGLAAPNSMSKGWHPTTVMGALGAAAAAARVLGLRGRAVLGRGRACLSSGFWHASGAERRRSGEAAWSRLCFTQRHGRRISRRGRADRADAVPRGRSRAVPALRAGRGPSRRPHARSRPDMGTHDTQHEALSMLPMHP